MDDSNEENDLIPSSQPMIEPRLSLLKSTMSQSQISKLKKSKKRKNHYEGINNSNLSTLDNDEESQGSPSKNVQQNDSLKSDLDSYTFFKSKQSTTPEKDGSIYAHETTMIEPKLRLLKSPVKSQSNKSKKRKRHNSNQSTQLDNDEESQPIFCGQGSPPKNVKQNESLKSDLDSNKFFKSKTSTTPVKDGSINNHETTMIEPKLRLLKSPVKSQSNKSKKRKRHNSNQSTQLDNDEESQPIFCGQGSPSINVEQNDSLKSDLDSYTFFKSKQSTTPEKDGSITMIEPKLSLLKSPVKSQSNKSKKRKRHNSNQSTQLDNDEESQPIFCGQGSPPKNSKQNDSLKSTSSEQGGSKRHSRRSSIAINYHEPADSDSTKKSAICEPDKNVKQNNSSDSDKFIKSKQSKRRSRRSSIAINNHESADSDSTKKSDICEPDKSVKQNNSLQSGSDCKKYEDSSDSGVEASEIETKYKGGRLIFSQSKQVLKKPGDKISKTEKIVGGLEVKTQYILDTTSKEEESDFDSNDEENGFLEPVLLQNVDRKFFKSIIRQIESFWSYDKNVVKKLDTLDIKINWKLPPLHEPDTFSFERPRLPHLEHLSEISYTTPFTLAENLKIVKNWKSFCKMYGFDSKDYRPFVPQPLIKDVNTIVCNHPEKFKFCQFLAKDLPDRMPERVYRRFNKMCRCTQKGHYSYAEDQLIISLYKHMKKTKGLFSICSTVLRRSRFSIWRRFHYTLVDAYNIPVKRGYIPYQHINERAVKVLATELAPILNQDSDKIKIDPSVVRAACKTVKLDPTIGEVLYYIKVFPMTRNKEIYKYKFRTDIIKGLEGVSDWDSDVWNKLGSSLSGVGSLFVYSEFRSMVKEIVPRDKWSNLKDVVDHLKENVYETYLKQAKICDVPMKKLKLDPVKEIKITRKINKKLNYL